MTACHSPRGRSRHLPALLGLLTLLACCDSRADGWFLKIEGVPGQLREGALAGWTPVQVTEAFASRPVDPTNGVPGQTSFSCELRKAVDCTTPWLLQKFATGEAFSRVALAYILSEPGATQYRISLGNVLVSSLEHHGSSSVAGTGEGEKVGLLFDKIEFAAFDLDVHGGTRGGLTGVFDQTTGLGTLKSRPPFRATVVRGEGGPGLEVTWPAEGGHRYQLQLCTAIGHPWTPLMEVTAVEDGPATQLVPVVTPMFFVRVEEID